MMPDREKVIKGLGNVANAIVDGYICEPDQAVNTIADAIALLKEQEHKDAMFHALEEDWKQLKELLKEQEAVKPKKVKGYNPPMYTIYEYECEKCKSPMMNKQPFCMGCGKPVNWNE